MQSAASHAQIDPDLDSIRAQIAKVKQTISRLIDGYSEGNDAVTLGTLGKAAAVVGREIRLQLV